MPKLEKQRKLIDRIRKQRVHRLKAKITGTAERPRLAVYRSLRHVSAQLIDDVAGTTIVSANDRAVDSKVKGTARAAAVGAEVAKLAITKGITVVVFDRRRYRFHGKVKALAEAAREGGLRF
ncbi:50S ribosomal protein L18 [Candidatus Uhrbacteria bacterium CG10_big_fil_rev_8_21_14_0_10_48_11]|uniref:Large ribosomal subunit protein uL18 n=1 Tax=Candidatus Uhrbacteria bacterium CG10_big_fil_rev_8_21_14_0_10_48_11 TaxID=1975037 RepID=A0A2M8LF02_9BACT|nr:MAG: 50S ribosomal protein L18 [Candidatus Uhrbacteria bacterium CG10_big_fil_rev_8_21_14_0_10_48_11]